MRLALAQMDCRLGDVEANLCRAEEFVETAVQRGADLIVFPELSLSGYSLALVSDDVALEARDKRVASLLKRAGKSSVLLGFLEREGQRTYNSAAYYQAGALVHLHRKLYPQTLKPFEEQKLYGSGQHMRAFDTALGRMAVLVCNDAWQPALGFLAFRDGAQVILVPANSSESLFPDEIDNEEYWYGITGFYARMFQSYVVFVNRVGEEGDLKFWGGSHVVDPSGRIAAKGPRLKEDLVIIDLDPQEVRRRRRALPMFTEARLDLLSDELDRVKKEAKDPYL